MRIDPQTRRWFPGISSAGPGEVRLYCLPHAGGSASAFASLKTAARARGLSVIAAEYPGHGTRLREPLAESVEDLAEALVGALPPWAPETPPILLGYSMGGLIAFRATQL